MKILFVIDSLVVGGAERHTLDLADALSRRGMQCRVVSVKSPPAAATDVRGFGAAATDEAARTCVAASAGALRYADARALFALRGILRDWSPDVLVAISPYTLMYAVLARGLCGRRMPTVMVFHITQLRNRKERLQQLLYDRFLAATDATVYVCQAQQDAWHRRGASTPLERVIHNGIDAARFDTALRQRERPAVRARFGLAPGEVVLGSCAMLRAEKNTVALIDAVAQLRAAGKPVRALIVGDGPQRPVLEAHARALGIAREVIFAGQHRDVERMVCAFDIGVLCSVAVETFSLAALEQMSVGVPMVMSDQGGAKEMVTDGVEGYVFPTRDLQAMVRAIDRLTDPSLRERMGQAAAQRVRRQFLHAGMVDAYARLFDELLALPSARSRRRERGRG